MKRFSVFVFCLLYLSCTDQKNEEIKNPFTKGNWIDLTYTFSDSTLYWPNNLTGFQLNAQADGVTPGGFYYSSYSFCAPEHGGTHLDAPVHFARGKQTADQIPLENLTGEAVVIDVSEKTLKILTTWYQYRTSKTGKREMIQ